MSEVVLKRRAPLDVVRYVLQKLEKQAVAAGSFPVLVHEGLEAEEKVRTEVKALREENARLTSEIIKYKALHICETDRADQAEAKLARCVEALEDVTHGLELFIHDPDTAPRVINARAALAAAKGE